MNFTRNTVGWLFALLCVHAVGCSGDVGGIGGVGPNTGGSATTTTSGGAGGAGNTATTTTTSATTTGTSGSTSQTGGAGGESGSGPGGGGGMGGTTPAADSGAAGSDAGNPGSTDGGTVTPSAGCGMAAGQALSTWVEQPKLSVNGVDRQWWVWLPTDYNPKRAYPLVFTFHGCGSPDNIVPIQKYTGADAIVVRGTGITGGCWTYGANGDDVKFFDAMLADVMAKRCMDSSRVFATGYSSGSWLINTLDCVRGDKLRATATVSGGVAISTTNCKGEYGRMFIHDMQDPANPWVADGDQAELARVSKNNHCMTTVPPVPENPAPCARYQGCDPGYPVVMCPTMGMGHNRRDDIAPSAFWKFFSSL
jgi:poly(3-hydroxybutyrate) depolymerase